MHAYVPLLLVSWGLLLYVCRVGRARFEFVELAGLSGYTKRRAAGDLALACSAFFGYAVGLGALAVARGSLVPGMLAHIGVDLIAGLTH